MNENRPNEKILFVDDEKNLLASYQRRLRKQYAIETACSGEEGLEKLEKNGPFALIVADRQMPGMDGTRLLALVKDRSPDTVRMMLTGNVDLEAAIRTVNEGGLFRFLTKPCQPREMAKALDDGLAQYRLVVAEKELLNKTLNGSIRLLTDILSLLDGGSFGRNHGLRDAIAKLTGKLQLPNAWEVHLAVMLAPIGHVTVPPELFIKSRSGHPLSEAETQVLSRVPECAGRLINNIPRLEGVSRIVQYQHKNFDGSGFPKDDVAGEAIPAGSRLLKILLDALELESKGISRSEALDTLKRANGKYDPALLAAVCEHWAPAPLPTTAASNAAASSSHAAAAKRNGAATVNVFLDNLAVGMVVRANVETDEGTIIIPAGTLLNDMALEKINNFARLGDVKEPIVVQNTELVRNVLEKAHQQWEN
jgi:response regulator RpfG family c-di-GMP phosphodiesterase